MANRNKSPLKNFGENGAWAYPETAQFFGGTPYYLGNGQSYGLLIWRVHLHRQSE